VTETSPLTYQLKGYSPEDEQNNDEYIDLKERTQSRPEDERDPSGHNPQSLFSVESDRQTPPALELKYEFPYDDNA